MRSTALSLISPWRCPSCRLAIRPFSTTIAQRRTIPESPRFIDIPQSIQPDRPRRTRIRGALPVPRDIFHRRDGGVRKAPPEHVANVTKETEKNVNTDPDAPSATYRDWKQRMAERRRQNYLEGLSELQARRLRTISINAARREANWKVWKEALEAPQREDERLTKPTTTALMQRNFQERGVLPDPNREVRIAAMKARVDAKEVRRSQERQEALHTLYMHARNFVTTEAQLDEMIEKQFGSPERPAMFGYRGTSIWNQKLPESIQEKLRKAQGANLSDDDVGNLTKLTDKRLRRIAEELTGGKM